MLSNTKYKVESILKAFGGLPEECEWLDYKDARFLSNKNFKQKATEIVVAFLNSVNKFNDDKYIIFGIREDKITNRKELIGLKDDKNKEISFLDDSDWQKQFSSITPNHPFIETGVVEYLGLRFGYIFISAINHKFPYSYKNIKYVKRGSDSGGSKNQLTIDEENILKSKLEKFKIKGRQFYKTPITSMLTLLGSWCENNKNDIQLIEKYTEYEYSIVKSHIINIDSSFSEEEKSIYGFCHMNSVVVSVQNKNERLLQMLPNELSVIKEIAIQIFKPENDVYYSEEIKKSVAETLVFCTNNGFDYFVNNIVTQILCYGMFTNPNIVEISESAPQLVLNYIDKNFSEFEGKKYKISSISAQSCYVLQSLRVIAWFPEYFEQAVNFLIKLGDEFIHEVFGVGPIHTAANFEQKCLLLRTLDKKTVFYILNKVLYINPKWRTILTQNYIPVKYKRFNESTVYLDSFNIELQQYYSLLLECSEDDANCLLELLPDWLQPFPFANLDLLANKIESAEPNIINQEERYKLWNRLCNRPLVYIIENYNVEENLANKLRAVGEKFKPTDALLQVKHWFEKDIIQSLGIDTTSTNIDRYDKIHKTVFEEQKSVLIGIYNNSGINGLIFFIKIAEYIEKQPKILTPMLLALGLEFSCEEEKEIINAFLSSNNLEVFREYFSWKSYSLKLEWIKTLDISSLSVSEKVKLFVVMYPNIENIKWFEDILSENKILYWQGMNPQCISDYSTLKHAFKQFLDFNLPQKAFSLLSNCLNNDDDKEPEWYCDCLLKLNCYDDFNIEIWRYAKIYQWLIKKHIGNDKIEQLEWLSFKKYGVPKYDLYGLKELKPQIIFGKIVNDANFLINVLKCSSPDNLSFKMGSKLSYDLLNACDAKSQNPKGWNDGIEQLIKDESEEIKTRAHILVGRFLYQTLSVSESKFEIEDRIKFLLG